MQGEGFKNELNQILKNKKQKQKPEGLHPFRWALGVKQRFDESQSQAWSTGNPCLEGATGSDRQHQLGGDKLCKEGSPVGVFKGMY